MKAAAVLMEILRSAGVRYLFGNPGTTELTLLDALPDSGLEYVLALQEAVAVSAADGYSQASGRVSVANVHVAPGVGNSMSILHNAARARSPVLLTAGQQDTRLLIDEPILAGDLVQMTEQYTKWSYEVRRAEEVPIAVRRALKLALTPPTGPVFLSLPMDLLTREIEDSGEGPPVLAARSRPDPEAVGRAVELLLAARSPLIVAGDGVARAGGMSDLVAVAELLGARVHGEPVARRTSFPGDHSLWRGGLFPTTAGVRRALESADCVLIAGAAAFTWLFQSPVEPFPRGLPVIQIDADPWEVGKSHGVSVGIVADPAATLRALGDALSSRMTDADRERARARAAEVGRARAGFVQGMREAAEADRERAPISAAFLFHTLAGLVPKDVIVVDESASSLRHVLGYMPFAAPDSFFGSRTGTLGWAMGAAIGVHLAHPGRRVVATIGDGSVMYAPQALWTAARYRVPVTYVVPNNTSYAILKSGMLTLGLDSAKRGIFPGMDLVEPAVDYVGLARALGVRAERVERPDNLRDVLQTCLAHEGPSLVDVAIDRGVKAMT
jgi:benzoylformate decarboxylase